MERGLVSGKGSKIIAIDCIVDLSLIPIFNMFGYGRIEMEICLITCYALREIIPFSFQLNSVNMNVIC